MIINKNSENYTFQDVLDDKVLKGNIVLLSNGCFDMNFHVGQFDYVSYGRTIEGNYFLNVSYGRGSTLMNNLTQIIDYILEQVGYEEPQQEEEQTSEETESQD